MRVSLSEVLCYTSSKKVLVENLRKCKSLFLKIFICFHSIIKLAQTRISATENKEIQLWGEDVLGLRTPC